MKDIRMIDCLIIRCIEKHKFKDRIYIEVYSEKIEFDGPIILVKLMLYNSMTVWPKQSASHQ